MMRFATSGLNKMRALTSAMGLLLFTQGCTTLSDGVAAISGKGGTIERYNEMEVYEAAANSLASGQPRPLSIGVELWRSERPSLMKSHGRYSVLTGQPNIVMVSRDSDSTNIFLIDIDTGARLWQANYQGDAELALLPDRLIVATMKNGRLEVEARALDSATRLWSNVLQDTNAQDIATPLSLMVLQESVYVLAGDLFRLSVQSGQIDWQAMDVASDEGNRNLVPADGGLLLWNSSGLTFIRDADGRVLWDEKFAAANALKLVSPVGDRVIAVMRQPKAFDQVSSYELDSGRQQWKVGAGGLVASVLLRDSSNIVYSVDDALMTMRVVDGERIRQTQFPRSFIQAAPVRDVEYMQPDIISHRLGKTLVARDLFGILAIDDQTGDVIWSHQQPTTGVASNPYIASNRYKQLKLSLVNNGVSLEDTSNYSANSWVNYTQQTLQVNKSHWQGILDDPSSQLWERSAATDMMIFSEQMAVASGLLNASVAMASTIDAYLKKAGIEGMVSRFQEQMAAGVDMQLAGLKGGYYVRSYFTSTGDAKGVMIVDLSNGRRADILTGPNLAPIWNYGLDLPTLAIDGGHLMLVDINLYPDTWRDYVKNKFRVPRPSLLSYDLEPLLK